jgi:hypothetical protein
VKFLVEEIQRKKIICSRRAAYAVITLLLIHCDLFGFCSIGADLVASKLYFRLICWFRILLQVNSSLQPIMLATNCIFCSVSKAPHKALTE